ncbi:hypothetical protein AND_006944 [Anopheles darlingi]|uniref:Uncharacterized protein n=1 Tax=Anopheles darlingi TaxID=43151 RepID=W5JAE7_ANODA|nr:hypothetical protein AND_006944 [Anopheles darlingi]
MARWMRKDNNPPPTTQHPKRGRHDESEDELPPPAPSLIRFHVRARREQLPTEPAAAVWEEKHRESNDNERRARVLGRGGLQLAVTTIY